MDSQALHDEAEAQNTPIGYLPYAEDINLEGLDNFSRSDVEELLSIEPDLWAVEILRELKSILPTLTVYRPSCSVNSIISRLASNTKNRAARCISPRA